MQPNMKPLVYAALFRISAQRSTVLLELFFFLFFFPEDPLTLREAKYVLLHLTSHSSLLLPEQRQIFSLCMFFSQPDEIHGLAKS